MEIEYILVWEQWETWFAPRIQWALECALRWWEIWFDPWRWWAGECVLV